MAAAAQQVGPVTTRLYYQDTYKEECTAKVLETGRDDTGPYFIPDQTVFHPQGGGQPSDKGSAVLAEREFVVVKLVEDGEAIKHYTEGMEFGLGTELTLKIDMESRRVFARLHTAGHLISDVIGQRYPGLTGYRGNHFPGGKAFVVFKGEKFPTKAEVMENVQPALNAMIQEGRTTTTNCESQPRTMQIEGFDALGCGGTHVRNISEIEGITIRSVKKQKGDLKVGYDLKAEDQRAAYRVAERQFLAFQPIFEDKSIDQRLIAT